MEQQATEKLGEQVRMVATVSTKGTGKKIMTAGVAQQLGGALGATAANSIAKKRSPGGPGGHSGYMVLALGETNLGMFKQKTGLLKPSCGDLLETIPLDQITKFELGGGALTAPLVVGLADGSEFELEVPRAHKGKVEKLRAALNL
jgi:hypothetical protein